MLRSSTTLLLILTGCGSAPDPPRLQQRVATVRLGEARSTDERSITGVLQAANAAPLSLEVGGKVEAVPVDIGAEVAAGDELVRLERLTYELVVRERRGLVSEAEASLVEARRDFERKRSVGENGAVPEAEIDVARARFESAGDRLEIAKARLEIARDELEDTVLLAPYGGVVSARHVEPSQIVAAGAPVLQLESSEGLEVSLLASESIVSALSIGDRGDVWIPALDARTGGSIARIGASADAASAFSVIVRLDEGAPEALRTGMSAEVTFGLELAPTSAAGHVVPVSALGAGADGEHYLLVVEQDAGSSGEVTPSWTLRRTAVTLIDTFEQKAVIDGDLAEGLLVVRAGLPFLHDGQRVVPADVGVRRFNP